MRETKKQRKLRKGMNYATLFAYTKNPKDLKSYSWNNHKTYVNPKNFGM